MVLNSDIVVKKKKKETRKKDENVQIAYIMARIRFSNNASDGKGSGALIKE